MKKSYWMTAFAGLFVVALSGLIFYQLYTAFLSFDTVRVTLRPAAPNPRAAQIDKVLFENIRRAEDLREFRHVLSREERKINVGFQYADQCEVTQREFQMFAQWARRQKTNDIGAAGQPTQWKYMSNTKSHAISGKLNAAVTGVTYYDAYGYCKAAGGRLPTTDEWIALATGRDGRLYPWSNEMDKAAWPYLDPLLNATQKCGIHKSNRTPEGIYQLGHGVSEWAQNPEEPMRPSVHGGNAFNQPQELYALSNMYRYAQLRYRSPYLGFRCVYDRRAQATPWRTRVRAAKVAKSGYRVGMPDGMRVAPLMLNIKSDAFDLVDELFGDSEGVARTLDVMRGEVTRAQYRLFLNDPLVRFGFYANDNQPRAHDYRPADWDGQLAQPDLPVVGVDWWSAYAYALWIGGRLPSASEWAALASDFGRSVYPWGNKYEPGAAMTADLTPGQAQAMGAFPRDKTTAGLFDMGGNVSEWTRSAAISSAGYGVIIKGGSHMLPGKDTARIDFANQAPPGYRDASIGFRVVFDR